MYSFIHSKFDNIFSFFVRFLSYFILFFWVDSFKWQVCGFFPLVDSLGDEEFSLVLLSLGWILLSCKFEVFFSLGWQRILSYLSYLLGGIP